MNYLRRLQLARELNKCLQPDGGGAGGSGAGSGDGQGAGSGEGNGGNSDAGAGGEGSQGGKEKTFTQTELDRIISDRLTKAEQKFKEKLEAEKAEAEKLAKMNADERAKAEFEKQQKKFNDDKQAFERERMELETTKMLAAEKLPVEFAKMLMGDTAEATKTNVEAFKTQFSEAIEAAVTERLRGNPPRGGGGSSGDGTTVRDEIKNALFGKK